MQQDFIEVKRANENNLRDVSLRIPKNKLVVITGLSGSGKSSLAFDTLYAEGQRRYVESLSAYARQFLQLQNKPNVESITGLSPAIAIDQRGMMRNPRSTVGTVTEIYDYLRLLYARVGVPYSPATGLPIESQSASRITERIASLPEGTAVTILAPIVRGEKGTHQKELLQLKRQGFQRVRVDGSMYMLDDASLKLDKNKKHDVLLLVDRLTISSEMGNTLASSVETALKCGEGIVIAEVEDEAGPAELIFSEKFCCPVSGFQIEEIEPRIFSFNSPYGACPSCQGLGIETFFDKKLIIPNTKLSINEGAIAPWQLAKSRLQLDMLKALSRHYKFNLDWPFEELSKDVQNMLFMGSGGEKIEVLVTEGMQQSVKRIEFPGIIGSLELDAKQNAHLNMQDVLEKFQSYGPCKACEGYRIKREALCVKIDGKHIGEIATLTIRDALHWFEKVTQRLSKKQNEIAAKVIHEIASRLKFLVDVGLDYLTLSRKTDSISGGESQRIRLASQIGSGLSGVLYVLDEPSIGLHQRDNIKLISTLRRLADLQNTVIVVEHDEETIFSADHVIDIGPGAGAHGGTVMAQGTIQDILACEQSLTGQYLKGTKSIAIPKLWRKGSAAKRLKLLGANINNLKDVSIDIPLGTFVSVTGVSGSGKSSLIMDTLYEAVKKTLAGHNPPASGYKNLQGVEYLDKVIDITQSPIGRTPRSNPATYIGAFSAIREWFARLPEAQARGYSLSRFSFNVRGGRCEACQGDGLIKMEMHFLPDVYVQCEECKGKRYNKETLEVKYKDKSISEVLEMTVEDAAQFFNKVPSIKDKMDVMMEVGLSYIKLGQPATSLSGGEAQRIKLAKELSKHSTGSTLYILDEPTTGLHIDDVNKLLKVLHELVNRGNTVIVIEHNMHVIKTSDYIIDMGPDGGAAGGEVVSFGPPTTLMNNNRSITGQYLKKYFEYASGIPMKFIST
jgi:excinuclease ABC subunit A